MSKFPEPVQPPEAIPLARANRYKCLMRSSLQGILIRFFIAIISLIFALIYDSAALFMDALSTGFDIISSLILMLSFWLASRPPDANHPFGHGRYEPLAGLQLGLFLAIFGFGMFFYNIFQINQVDAYNIAIHPQLWIIPFISIILLEISYRILMRSAKKENSPALAADAVHYRVDSITSFLALIALLFAGYSPRFSQLFDHAGAAFISIFMIIVGSNAARSNMHQLLDRIPTKEYFDRIKKAALKAQGALGTEKIGMQLSGPDAHINIDVEVDPGLSVEEAHEISQKVRYEIQKELPIARDVIVHIEPYYPNDHKDQ